MTKVTFWLVMACATSVLGDGLSDYTSSELKTEFSRVFRPGQNAQQKPSRKFSQQERPITYGVKHPARATVAKFKLSPRDPFSESNPLLQKYANQLYTAQKNAAKLSDYQKYVISQDPTINQFVFGTTRTAKALEQTTSQPTTTTTTKSIEDSNAEGTAYKYVYEQDQQKYVHVPVYTTGKQTYAIYGTAAADNSADAYGQQIFTYPQHVASDDDDHYPTKEPEYEFKYQVKDPEQHNNFGHAETRKGKTTWGKYYVQLSDGRFETVKYWADKTGYHAQVDFKGQAQHPPTKPKNHDYVVSHSPHQYYTVEGLSINGYH